MKKSHRTKEKQCPSQNIKDMGKCKAAQETEKWETLKSKNRNKKKKTSIGKRIKFIATVTVFRIPVIEAFKKSCEIDVICPERLCKNVVI